METSCAIMMGANLGSRWMASLNRQERIGAAAIVCLCILLIGGLVFVEFPNLRTDPSLKAEVETVGLLENRLAEVSKNAPDFRLYNLKMQPVRLSDLHGTPIVMNFFASWCAPCKIELPFLKAAHELAEDRGFMILGISNNDRREAMEAFAKSENLTYPIVIDGDNTVGVAYQVLGPPYTYFIDGDGQIAAVVRGELDEATLEDNLNLLLN